MYCRLDLVLIDVSTSNPFSDQELIEKLTSAQIMVTVENHRVSSGLGKIVGQVLHQERASTTLITVGVGDTFAHGGSVPYLEEFYGTSRSHIAQAIRGALGMKSDPRGAVTIGGSVELADGIAEGLQRSVSYPVGGNLSASNTTPLVRIKQP